MFQKFAKLHIDCFEKTISYFEMFDDLMHTETKEKLKSLKLKNALKAAKDHNNMGSLLRLEDMERKIEELYKKVSEYSKHYISCIALNNASSILTDEAV